MMESLADPLRQVVVVKNELAVVTERLADTEGLAQRTAEEAAERLGKAETELGRKANRYELEALKEIVVLKPLAGEARTTHEKHVGRLGKKLQLAPTGGLREAFAGGLEAAPVVRRAPRGGGGEGLGSPLLVG